MLNTNYSLSFNPAIVLAFGKNEVLSAAGQQYCSSVSE